MSFFHRFKSAKPAAVSFCICCLGNPGAQYEHTRHNVGFRTADRLAALCGIRLTRLRFHALCGEGEANGCRFLLLKPQTYMNDSGKSARAALDFYKLPPEKLIVVCDEMNLPPGRIRVRASGSDGGQKGMKSVLQHVGSDRFPRVRIGIGRPPHPDFDVTDYVLGRFPADELPLMDDAVCRAADAVLTILSASPEEAANRFNGA